MSPPSNAWSNTAVTSWIDVDIGGNVLGRLLRYHCAGFAFVLEALTVAADLHDVGMVQQTVE